MSETVDRWLDGYRAAWEQRDPDAAAALFTDDAIYREHPYESPVLGQGGVREYWARVTATQDEVKVRYGAPLIDGRRAAVEWWVTMRNQGAEITLAGEFLLLFDDVGLCSELREYWHFGEGRIDPPKGWGA